MKWRVIIDPPSDGYRNMSVDEALVLSVKKKGQPTLRLYTWSSESISFGYNQKVREVLDIERCLAEGIPFVRRPTGGGIVIHSDDLTYSISVPAGFFRDVREGYLFIQGIVRGFFNSLGIESELFVEVKRPDLKGSCLGRPNFSDIMVGDKKICGLAVRKIQAGILYQGYILLYPPGNSVGCILDKAQREMVFNGSVSLADLIGDFSVEDIINRVRDVFAERCDVESARLDEEEEELATALEAEKYSTDEWNLLK